MLIARDGESTDFQCECGNGVYLLGAYRSYYLGINNKANQRPWQCRKCYSPFWDKTKVDIYIILSGDEDINNAKSFIEFMGPFKQIWTYRTSKCE